MIWGDAMTNNKFVTVVVRMPEDPLEKASVKSGLELLAPHTTAMSLEDEMTTLELVENHPDFPLHISDDARSQVAEIHRRAGM